MKENTKEDTLGERVLWLRRREGITQDQLGEATSLDRSQISRIERDQSLPSVPTLIGIARTLKTDVHFLVTGEELTPDAPEPYHTPEANEVALLLDSMDDDMRRAVLHLVRDLSAIDAERRSLQTDYATILTENIQRLEAKEQQRARLILSKISRRRDS